MVRMGYVVGQGLGKNSEGRAEPVPIQLLPQGQSVVISFIMAARPPASCSYILLLMFLSSFSPRVCFADRHHILRHV